MEKAAAADAVHSQHHAHHHDHGCDDHHHGHDHDHEHVHDHDHDDHDHHHHHHHDHGCDDHHHGHDHDHVHDHDDEQHHHHQGTDPDGYWTGKDGKLYHTHDGLAPHTHEPLDSPGYFTRRAQRLANRDFVERAFTVGIGGPVGSGKTALMLELCMALRDKYSIAAVTNDIFTREDGEFLVKHGALAPERITAVETGGCPHAAIREDISINLGPLEELSRRFSTEILLCESGGDNLAANFSRELADYIIYIIDVAGGDKIPRKGGPGITQADLLVINKTDLAEAVGANLKVMEQDALKMRDGGPFIFAQIQLTVKASIEVCLAQQEIIDFNREIADINAREEYDDKLSRNKEKTRRDRKNVNEEEKSLQDQDNELSEYIAELLTAKNSLE